MTERITIRQMVEYEIVVDEDEKDMPEIWQDISDVMDYKTLSKEVVKREHKVDYVLDIDEAREVWILRGDGEIVFESRSHDLRNKEYLRLTGHNEDVFGGFSWIGDEEDHDLSWNRLKESRKGE